MSALEILAPSLSFSTPSLGKREREKKKRKEVGYIDSHSTSFTDVISVFVGIKNKLWWLPRILEWIIHQTTEGKKKSIYGPI